MNCRNSARAVILVSIAVLSGGLSGCSDDHRVEPAAQETVNNVAVIVAQKQAIPDWLEAVGTVRAAQTSQVSSQMMGTIVEIRSHEGDRVEAGQVLATIDDAQPRTAMDRATAAMTMAEQEVSGADSDLTLAQATWKRYQDLYEKKSVSPQEFDEVKARYQAAEARREMARAGVAQANTAVTQATNALGYTQILAPFAGLVTEKNVDAGTLASPGMPIFTLEDTHSFRLEVTVDESDLRLVRVGQLSPVTIDALGDSQLSGKIAQIVPAADAASRSFLVKVQLPSDVRLRSGLFGRARFSRGERTALLVPGSSVVRRGQLQGIYVLDANRIAGLRYVTLGKSAGESFEVLSGLQAGEKVVAAPGDHELGGKRIEAGQ